MDRFTLEKIDEEVMCSEDTLETTELEDLKTLIEELDVLNDFEVPEKPIIPQEEGTSCGDGNKFGETVDIINVDLMKRLKKLQEHVIELRKELNIEKTLWQNEVEEYDEIQKHLDEHKSKGNLHLGLPYETNWDLYETANTDKDLSAKELAIIEYEKKLERYQEALALAQSEKRLQIRRQIAANAYKIKLLEVEKMCNTELERVRQSFTSLESLNKIASDWNLDNSEIGGSKYAPMISEDFGIGHEVNSRFSFTENCHKTLSGLNISCESDSSKNNLFSEIVGPNSTHDHISDKLVSEFGTSEPQPLWKGDGFN